MLILILGVLCSAMLLVTVIAMSKYKALDVSYRYIQSITDGQAHTINEYCKRLSDLRRSAEAVGRSNEAIRKDLESERKRGEMYKSLYRASVDECHAVRQTEALLREQLANKTQECVVLARELDTYIAKFEGDM